MKSAELRVSSLSSSTRNRVSWPHLLLAMMGFAIAAYALVVHFRIKAGGDSGCGFSETINCNAVLTSRYAEIFHVPLGAWGMLFFVLIALTSTWKENFATARADEIRARLVQLLFATCGFATSVLLTFISYTQLHALCPICLSTHAVTTTLFLFSLCLFRKAKS